MQFLNNISIKLIPTHLDDYLLEEANNDSWQFNSLFFDICLYCVCACACIYAMIQTWRSKDSVWELVLNFHVRFGNQIQVISLGDKGTLLTEPSHQSWIKLFLCICLFICFSVGQDALELRSVDLCLSSTGN